MHAQATAVDAALLARLYDQSGAARWGLARDRFDAAIAASLASARASAGAPIDAEQYASALHLEDLALAAACASGLDAAWEHFATHYRPLLQRAAAAVDQAGGAELADSLFGDLFGLEVKAGSRQSLFRYFHGRSKLATWLRAVLAQRHVDRLRIAKRHEPLPDEGESLEAPAPAADATERSRFVHMMRLALSTAIATLPPQDRLRLGLYYAEDMTLAAIGKLVGEHEATVSRQIARARRQIRAATEECLRATHGLDERAIAECFQSVTADAGDLDLGELLGTSAARKNAAADRSTK